MRELLYGSLMASAGRLEDAAEQFHEAVRCADPGHHLRFAAWLRLRERMDEAEKVFAAWMAAAPDEVQQAEEEP